MAQLAPLDSLTVTVVIDNATDSLSTNPPGVVAEWSGLLSRGRMRMLSGPAMCCAHHGLSLWLEAAAPGGRHCALFDVGPEGGTFERNAGILGLDLSQVSDIVLSHGHWDHGGALTAAIRSIAAARRHRPACRMHPGVFGRRALRLPSGVMLPMEPIASPADLAEAGATVVADAQPQFFGDGCFFTSGEIPRRTSYEKGLPNQVRWSEESGDWEPDPLLLDERYMAVHVRERGLVVFSACSHAGIVNVLLHARESFPEVPLYGVFGGFHLSGSTEAVIPQTVDDLQTFGLKMLAPGHCTGWRAIAEMARSCPGELVPLAVGKRYTIEAAAQP